MRIAFALLTVGALLVVTPTEGLAQKKSKDLITNEEIAASAQRDLDLFSAIKALRPRFLDMPRGVRTMGGASMYPILVVVDGRRGDAEALEQLRAIDVKEVRYLDPTKSQNEYGINANGGAIVVKLMTAKDKEAVKPPKDTLLTG